jgi:phospholipase C
MVAAQAGREDPTLNYYSVAGIPQSPTKPNQIRWGCDAAPDTLVNMLSATGQRGAHFPCFGFKSLPDELQATGVSWAYYADQTSMSSVHMGVAAMSSVRYDPVKWANVRTLSSFIPDAQAGRLPAVTWVTGDHLDHPVHTGCEGENEASTFINAVMSGPDWSSTAIFMTWDEWGGFYDHVAPPQKDNISYGFRVPIVAISPFTKTGPSAGGGYVSHLFYSFGSLLKFAEVNWNLPSLTTRDAGANSLMDFFDFSGVPPRPAVLTQILACHPLTPQEQLIWKGEIDD